MKRIASWKILVVITSGSMLFAGAARSSEMIYSISEGAFCRDAAGRIIEPRSVPSLPIAGEKSMFGMIKAANGGKPCFFNLNEVSLSPPGSLGKDSCPDASLGQEQSTIAGTRKFKNCSH